MKQLLSHTILQLVFKLILRKWKTSGLKLLCFEPDRKKMEILQHLFDEQLQEKVELQIVRNKYHFLKLAPDANYIYSYGLSKYFSPDKNQLRFIYFGLTGTEFLRPEKIQGIKWYSPKIDSFRSIAEFTLLSALALIHKYDKVISHQIKKKWDQAPWTTSGFASLKEKKIGVFGVGRNGKEIAKLFSEFGCHVMGCDQNIDHSFTEVRKWYGPGQLKEFSKECDILIISVPLTSQTKKIINRNVFQSVKKGSYIINTARGAIMNNKDLIEAIREKKVAGAALDVFDVEPLPKKHKFWKMPEIIVTPHIFGNTGYFTREIYLDLLGKIKDDMKNA